MRGTSAWLKRPITLSALLAIVALLALAFAALAASPRNAPLVFGLGYVLTLIGIHRYLPERVSMVLIGLMVIALIVILYTLDR